MNGVIMFLLGAFCKVLILNPKEDYAFFQKDQRIIYPNVVSIIIYSFDALAQKNGSILSSPPINFS